MKHLLSHALCTSLILTLTACGGGGGGGSDNENNNNNTDPPNNSEVPQPGNGNSNDVIGGEVPRDRRISTISYDFDNNGVVEGRAFLDYDGDGRLESIRYEYFDDLAPDTDFGSFSLDFGQDNIEHEYEYDRQGRLTSFIINRASSRLVQTYTWNDQNLVTNYDIAFYDGAGGLQNIVRFALVYDNRLLTSWREEFEPTGSASISLAQATLSYNPETGLPSLISRTENLSGLTENMAYAFNALGSIETITTTTPGNPAYRNSVQFFYDAPSDDGISEYNILERSTIMENPDEAYSWAYNYDDGSPNTALDDGLLKKQLIDIDSDGTVEAAISYDYTIGLPCLPTYLWAPRAEPNFIATGHEPFIPGTGYLRLDYCDSHGSTL